MSLPKECTRSSTPVSFLLLVLPFAVWCFLYRNFLTGASPVNEDTFSAYALVKYLVTSLRMGVCPHWVPFIHWGMADVYQVGEFNPMWLFTMALSLGGIPFYTAFVLTIALYFWVGALGVYALAGRVLKENFPAYLAYLLFLFSCVGMTVFTQVNLILVFVPAVWFFYFCAAFYQDGKKYAVLGMSFTLMLVLTTYIPFYFITACLCMIATGLFLYPGIFSRFVARVQEFCAAHAGVAVLAVAGVATAALQAFLNWKFLNSGFIALARPAVMNYATVQNAGIPIEEVTRDTSLFHFLLSLLQLPIMTFVKEIFSLSNIPADDQRIFYIPVLAHLVLFCACFIRLRRSMVFWAGTAFLLFIIALAGLMPLYALLFKYVPFFKMFRNIFFMVPFIVLAYVLLAASVWQAFWMEGAAKNYGRAGAAAAMLVFYWWYWFKPGYFLLSSSVTVAALLVLIMLRFSGVLSPRGVAAKCALVALAILGPLEVLHLHSQAQAGETRIIRLAVNAPLQQFGFSYVRPQDFSVHAVEALDIYHMFNWYIIQMQDEPGNRLPYGYATGWSHELAAVDQDIPGFDEYARHKFVAYGTFDDSQSFTDVKQFAAWFPQQPPGQFIDAHSPEISVARFNANQLHVTTHFAAKKFLVYNDSYHPFWQARVDGTPVPIARANYAFKGVWVPAGDHELHFDFRPPGSGIFVAAVFVVFLAYLLLTAWYRVRRV